MISAAAQMAGFLLVDLRHEGTLTGITGTCVP
jgi:hypothetical protein